MKCRKAVTPFWVVRVVWLGVALVFPDVVAAQDNAQAGKVTLESGVFEARGEEVECEYGKLWVPVDYADPEGPLYQLAFVRFPSTAAQPGSPIVYLAGGPGGSGIGTARGSRFDLFMALRQVADVIAWDQRGTGGSEPPDMQWPWNESFPLNEPGDPETYVAIAQRQATRATAAMEERGIDLGVFTTRESAGDLETLRVAIGADKLTLWGISYGTHLGLGTARFYPESIDKLILAGVEGPDHTIKTPQQIQENLEKLAGLVQSDPTYRELMPDFLVTLRDVLQSLEAQPIPVSLFPGITVTVGKWDLQRALSSGMGSRSAMETMPAQVYAMSKGEFFDLGRWMMGYRMNRVARTMSLAMDCASYATPQRLSRNQAAAADALLGYTIDFPMPGGCEVEGLPRLDDSFRAELKTDIPTLFVSGTLDGRTPVSNAEEVALGFSNYQHLIIDRAAHSNDLFLSSPVILETMLAFLQDEPVTSETIEGPEWQFARPYERSLQREMIALLASEGYEAASARYAEIWRDHGDDYVYNLDESVLNVIGYDMMGVGMNELALGLFKLNTQGYPDASNVWDSLAECYMEMGNKPHAIENYEKSLQLNPANGNAQVMLDRLREDL